MTVSLATKLLSDHCNHDISIYSTPEACLSFTFTHTSTMSYLPPGWTESQLRAATVDDLRRIPEDVSL
jgi:hypothetical protein